jgi:hypothetical protein
MPPLLVMADLLIQFEAAIVNDDSMSEKRTEGLRYGKVIHRAKTDGLHPDYWKGKYGNARAIATHSIGDLRFIISEEP